MAIDGETVLEAGRYPDGAISLRMAYWESGSFRYIIARVDDEYLTIDTYELGGSFTLPPDTKRFRTLDGAIMAGVLGLTCRRPLWEAAFWKNYRVHYMEEDQ